MRQDLFTNVFNYLVRSWCRVHGKPAILAAASTTRLI
jgi:hypothetical protein